MGKNDTRIIHDAEWRRLKDVFNRPDFQKWVRAIRRRFTDYGMDVPDGGFKKGSDYYDWLTQPRQSKRYLQKKAQLDASIKKFKVKKSLTIEEYQQLREMEDAFFPYHWGDEFSDCLKQYGLNPENKDHQRWLEHAVFLNVPDSVRSLAEYKIVWDKELKKPAELWVRYYGHTRGSDIPADELASFQKNLPDYIGRNASPSDRVLTRNKEIVECYLAEKNKKDPTLRERRSPENAIYRTVAKAMKKKYREVNEATVKTAVAKSKRGDKQQGKT